MGRFAVCCFLSMLIGCSGATESNNSKSKIHTEIEDVGSVKNAERDQAEKYFTALEKVQSLEEEKKLLTGFGQWLTKVGYKIRVEKNKERYNLSCPYFPPTTPWIEHTFYDIQNLELVPRLEDRETKG